MTQARLTIKIWNDEHTGKPLPTELSEAFAPHIDHVAGLCRQGYLSGEIVDEDFSGGWWDIYMDPDEDESARRGALLAEVMGLKRDKIARSHWATSWGSKTDLGLFKTIKRIIEEGK